MLLQSFFCGVEKIEYQYFSGYCIKVKVYYVVSIANSNLHICL